MLLLIDADNNATTGWHGYDYIVNRKVVSSTKTIMMRWNGHKWSHPVNISYAMSGNQMEIAIPRKLLKLQGKAHFKFDFKWCDNPQSLSDPISLCTDGDAAPNRRFNYRCIWKVSAKPISNK